jgi:hypothetical protein
VQVVVCPQVLIFRPCVHDGAAFVARRAFTVNDPKKEGKFVVGIHRVNCQPFVRVFGSWTGDGGAGDAGGQGGLGIAVERDALSAGVFLDWFEGSACPDTTTKGREEAGEEGKGGLKEAAG